MIIHAADPFLVSSKIFGDHVDELDTNDSNQFDPNIDIEDVDNDDDDDDNNSDVDDVMAWLLLLRCLDKVLPPPLLITINLFPLDDILNVSVTRSYGY
uniref:Uncharacterized protein n=1 Tax=Bracon brevicornis TaxID=1563983 RepID=A0A6V7MAY6_9HYME